MRRLAMIAAVVTAALVSVGLASAEQHTAGARFCVGAQGQTVRALGFGGPFAAQCRANETLLVIGGDFEVVQAALDLLAARVLDLEAALGTLASGDDIHALDERIAALEAQVADILARLTALEAGGGNDGGNGDDPLDCDDGDPTTFDWLDDETQTCQHAPIRQELDMDGDGYDAAEDCNDSNPFVYPGAPEVPDNGIDDDCDGQTDEPGDVAARLGGSDARSAGAVLAPRPAGGFREAATVA